MRRNFAQVLREGKIDLKTEYTKLYAFFYSNETSSGETYRDFLNSNFHKTPTRFRKTCITLDDFDEMFEFQFECSPNNFDLDYLINFSEYIYNLSIYIPADSYWENVNQFFLNHIQNVIESIGYMKSQEDGFTIFVPKDSVAIAVSELELIPNSISYKIIAYNHHSYKGDIEGKKAILLKLAEILEGKRTQLKSISNQFESDLFQLINSCNIRHNNKDASIKGKYHQYIANLPDRDLEHIYDEIYQMCLLAFMQLEHAEKKEWLKALKDNIST